MSTIGTACKFRVSNLPTRPSVLGSAHESPPLHPRPVDGRRALHRIRLRRLAKCEWSVGERDFSLAILTVSVAMAGACSRQGAARMPWAGFAVAGGLTLVIWLSTSSTIGYVNGPPYPMLYSLQSSINPRASGGGPFISLYASLAFARCGSSRLPRGDHGSSPCHEGRTAESLIVAVSSQTGAYALLSRQSPAVKLHRLFGGGKGNATRFFGLRDCSRERRADLNVDHEMSYNPLPASRIPGPTPPRRRPAPRSRLCSHQGPLSRCSGTRSINQ